MPTTVAVHDTKPCDRESLGTAEGAATINRRFLNFRRQPEIRCLAKMSSNRFQAWTMSTRSLLNVTGPESAQKSSGGMVGND
jgi:hypothetical protein